MPLSESPDMATPILSFVLVAAGLAFFAIGVYNLSVCSGNALLLFGIGIFLVGVGAALVGGVKMFSVTAVLAVALVVIAYLSGHGANGCGF